MLSAVRDSKISMRDSKLLLSLVIRSRCLTVLTRSEIVVFYRVTDSSRSTRSLYMCLRLISCVKFVINFRDGTDIDSTIGYWTAIGDGVFFPGRVCSSVVLRR